jgi:ZIP family zinc transporter
LGAIPVWFLGSRAAALTPFLLGVAAGVMGVASIVGLLVPAAEEGSAWDLVAGLAVGAAYASECAGLGLFVILAIAIQNVPEGTSVAIPMEATGYGRARQFWAAVATSTPQPVGASSSTWRSNRSMPCCRSLSPSPPGRC